MQADYRGMPTPEEQYLLGLLMEECAEVIHAASKIIRFGFHGRGPWTSATNTQTLSTEVNDLSTIVSMLAEKRIVDPPTLNTGKRDKILDYLHRLKKGGDA